MQERCADNVGAASDAQVVRGLGAWAFRQRSWLPVPLALVLVFVRSAELRGAWVFGAGVVLVAAGQLLRFWAVRHIGVISRTRAGRLGPLITTGPFAWTRNPLYVGNWLIWTGFVVSSELLWMLPIAWAVFAVQYGAIIRWEEELLTVRFASAYNAYAARVPRWRFAPCALAREAQAARLHAWTDVLFSERGTLMAATIMLMLLIAKARLA